MRKEEGYACEKVTMIDVQGMRRNTKIGWMDSIMDDMRYSIRDCPVRRHKTRLLGGDLSETSPPQIKVGKGAEKITNNE